MYAKLDKSKPCPFPLPATATYLGEDENGYYHMDGFFDGLTNMFKRMVKFTPRSFQPKNILKAFTNTTVGVASGGLAYLAPKQIRKTIFKAGETIVPIVAAGAVAAAAAPAILGTMAPKLSAAGKILGKNANSIGGGVFKMFSALSESGQSQVAQRMTPEDIVYTEQHGSLPPNIQALVDRLERQEFEYAAAQTANTIMNPAQRMLTPPSTYGDARLYPGLLSQYQQKLAELQQGKDGMDWSPAVTVGATVGGTLLLILILRR